jgi:uncharacterized membrane protein
MASEKITKNKNIIMVTGVVGLLAALLVGTGEFLLHFDPISRYSETNYDFMLATSDNQQTLGHFFGSLAAPLYVIGCWHIYLMLSPANQKLAFASFIIGAFGFIVGAEWISSRASIGALIHIQVQGANLNSLIALYQDRYESLLTVIRITTLVTSIVFIYLAASGRSHYEKWHAFFSPIVLLLLSFVIYLVSPSIGKFLMPIALNIGFGLFFIMSLLQAKKLNAPA